MFPAVSGYPCECCGWMQPYTSPCDNCHPAIRWVLLASGERLVSFRDPEEAESSRIALSWLNPWGPFAVFDVVEAERADALHFRIWLRAREAREIEAERVAANDATYAEPHRPSCFDQPEIGCARNGETDMVSRAYFPRDGGWR